MTTAIAALPHKAGYARFLRTLASLDPDLWVIDPMSGWVRSRKPVRLIRAEARGALDRRINARGGQDWRNAPIDIDLIRDARDLDDMTQRRGGEHDDDDTRAGINPPNCAQEGCR
jgi:hypothetical protein